MTKRNERAAYIEGAEEDSRRRLGCGLTREELDRVLQRYPGDWELPPGRRSRPGRRRP